MKGVGKNEWRDYLVAEKWGDAHAIVYVVTVELGSGAIVLGEYLGHVIAYEKFRVHGHSWDLVVKLIREREV